MKRDFIFVFTLLAILSMVNAIPHQLHKRATNFIPCPGELYSSPLTVIVSPDPLVPGKTATYTISGKFAKAAPKGSSLAILFVESTGQSKSIGEPIIVDICANVKCPTDFFSSVSLVVNTPIPAALPDVYSNIVTIFDSAKNIYGCAITNVGGAGTAPKASTLSNLTF